MFDDFPKGAGLCPFAAEDLPTAAPGFAFQVLSKEQGCLISLLKQTIWGW